MKINLDILHLLLFILLPVFSFALLRDKKTFFFNTIIGLLFAVFGIFIVCNVLTFGKWIKMIAYVQNMILPWYYIDNVFDKNVVSFIFRYLPWYIHTIISCIYAMIFYPNYIYDNKKDSI